MAPVKLGLKDIVELEIILIDKEEHYKVVLFSEWMLSNYIYISNIAD